MGVYAIRLLAISLACFMVGKLGLHFAVIGTVSLVWLPAGLAVAVYLLGGIRYAPGIFVGVFFTTLGSGTGPALAAMAALPTTVAWAVAAAWLLRQPGFNSRFTRARNLPYALAATCGGAALSATLGVSAFTATGLLAPGEFFRTWLAWWAGDIQGVLYCAPLILSWSARPRIDRDLKSLIPVATAVLAVLLAGMLLSHRPALGPLAYLIWYGLFCLALWPAARLRLREVATSNVLIAAAAIWALSHGLSTLPTTTDGDELIVVHAFLTFLALTTLVLAGVGADLRRAVRQAQASEARFRSLADLSADWVWEQDENFRCTYLSPGYQAATGRDPAKVLGMSRWDLPADNMTETDWEIHRVLLKGRQPFHGFLREHRADNGEVRYIETSGAPVFDESGEFRGYRGVGRNVTTQKLAERSLLDSKKRLEDIVQASPQPITVSGVYSGNFHEVNTAWQLLLGYSRDEVIGRSALDLNLWVNPSDRDAIQAELLSQGAVAGAETCFRRKDGEILDVLFAASSVDMGGEPTMLSQIVDITEMKRAERLLRQSEERFSTVFRSSPAAIAISRLEDRAYVDVNDAWEHLFGWTRDEILGASIGFLDIWTDPSERERIFQSLATDVRIRDEEVRFHLHSGEIADVLLSAEVIDFGGERYVLASMVDITERKRSARRIEELATRDPLTGLPNRLLLHDRLSQGLTGARRTGDLVALMFIDLDRFKQINDSLGHEVGDMLLKQVAARIGDALRRGDTLARLGGDEFVVILEELKHAEDAGQVAQKIIGKLSDSFEVGGHALGSSASVGISIFPHDGDDGATLMRNADTAMYFAKESGRNCYRFFAAEMNTRAVERLELEMSIRRALAAKDFVLHFQPKFDVTSGELVGAEALVRWMHREQGLLYPDSFIQAMEDTGLIIPLGQWVIEEVCAQASRWKSLRRLPIALNVSARQFGVGLPASIEAALRTHDLDPALIEIEMTETTLMRGIEEGAAVLDQVRDLGVAVAIDDFGMGYSSFNYLKRFNISALKVDKSFVMELPASADDQAIVRAVVQMGHSLRLRVIAEGVETDAQLALLRQLGCDEYQGYFGGRPVPATEFETRYLKAAATN